MKTGNKFCIIFPVVFFYSIYFSSFYSFAGSSNDSKTFAGVVSAATPEAVKAGIEILEKGGNAIDAAVAVSFALAVSEPACSGLGGQTFFLIHSPKKEPLVINGTSLAPENIKKDYTPEDISLHRAATVPGTVKTLEYAWKNYGSGQLSWMQLLQPAIKIADKGYILGHFRYRTLARYAHRLRLHPATAKLFLLPDGSIPKIKSLMKQPQLADTLKRLAEFGANDFYNGKIARQIAENMAHEGGWIKLKDLEKFPQPKVIPSLKGSYRGWDVYTLPPPAGGWVVLQALNLLEHAPEEKLSGTGPWRRVWLAEVLRVSHENRLKEPIPDLKKYEEIVGKKIDKKRTKQLLENLDISEPGETTHFSIVDSQGTAVGVTQSLNSYFGAKVAHPELGFLYNDYMGEFDLENPVHPFSLQPMGMPYSSMSASILAKNGEASLILGSPGSKRIISTVVQIVSHWVDIGSGIVKAVIAPRLHVIPENNLFVEAKGLPPSHLLQLELLGYNVVKPLSSLYKGDLNPYFGGVHAVAKENGKWKAAADPRRDGTAGYAWIKKAP